MKRIMRWLRFGVNFVKKNPTILILDINDKKYLAVIKTGWNGPVWRRYFEIVQEVDELPCPNEIN